MVRDEDSGWIFTTVDESGEDVGRIWPYANQDEVGRIATARGFSIYIKYRSPRIARLIFNAQEGTVTLKMLQWIM